VTNDLELTLDAFIGGKVTVYQPRFGYRAGVDPVLLAGAVPAKSGQSVLELGCGVGVASLCLIARVPGLSVTGLEIQANYAALAAKNAKLNKAPLTICTADLADLPADLNQMSFDHVIANPPYFERGKSVAAVDAGRETALGESTPLDTWVKAAAKRLAPKGIATFIHRAERLPDLLTSFNGRLGSIQVLPLVARTGRDAKLIIVRGKKGGKAAFRMHDSVVMHRGDHHETDAGDYTKAIDLCLVHGQALAFPK
jgi:tRNA1(Val) A37 N6-methylase TrmN6